MALISIVVPVYNVEKYLKKCIDSLVSQTLNDIEIILVDDGSEDSSGKICDEYANRDNRIRVIHKKNGGLSDARNAGIQEATGEYIGFIDSDDWVTRDMYRSLYDVAINNDADIVQCNFIKVFSNNEPTYHDNKDIEIYEGINILENLLQKKYIETTVVWNKIYKRDLFEDIRYPVNKIHEDEFTTYKLLYKSKKLVDINETMVFYRQRQGSIMGSQFNVKRLDIIEALDERIDFFKHLKKYNLYEMTEAILCTTLRGLYVMSYNSQIENKEEIIKYIRKKITKNYKNFLSNKYLRYRDKVLITIAIINPSILCKIYTKRKAINKYS